MRKIFPLLSLFLALSLHSAFALTLTESVNLARQNNPRVIAAQKQLEAAEARLAQAVGAFLPTIKIDGNYNRTYTEPYTVQMSVPTTSGAVVQDITFGINEVGTVQGWQASFSQPLFVAALIPGYNIAKKGSELARAELKKAEGETTFAAIQSYYGVINAEKVFQLSLQAQERARAHLSQVEKMVGAGVASEADRLRTEVQLANAEVALVKAANALALARDNLNNILGLPSGEAPLLAEKDPVAGEIKLPGYEGILELAYLERPEWLKYRHNREVAEEQLSVARAEYFPSIFLNGQKGWQNTAYPAFSTASNSWSLAGVASWKLFDGLGVQNRIREAAANLEAQKAGEEELKRSLALEVRQAYLELKSGLESLGAAARAVTAAQANLKVAERRFRSGSGTNLELLDAQVSLTRTEIDRAQSHYDLAVGRAKLNKVVGREVI